MNHTTNYQLSQWEASDQLRRVDVNADNAKIDAALAQKADATALAALQNQMASAPKIATGTYVGTGTRGINNPTSLTLPFEAKLLIIMEDHSGQSCSGHFLRGCGYGMISWVGGAVSHFLAETTWSGRTVSWYVSTSDIYNMQLNAKDVTYHYFAIG